MISINDFVLRSELMKEVARLSDLCEQLHLKNITIKFNRDAGADAWANGQLVVTTKFIDDINEE